MKKELVKVTKRDDNRATRRRILKTGLAVVGGIASLVAGQARAQEKIAQAQVQYQKTPKDGQKCSNCVNFQTPNACKIVAGSIDPNGWCIAFAPKDQAG